MRTLLAFFILLSLPLFGLKLKPNHKYICYVTKVSDGDTIHCRFTSEVSPHVRTYPVRLIGIDTPETGERKKNTPKQEREFEEIVLKAYHQFVDLSGRDIAKMGLEAKKFTEKLLKDVYVVTLETDVQPTDHYGRILGYIWLPDGRMLNAEIICNGYALPLTVPPNVKYEKVFLKCFRKALREQRGLWGELVK